MRNFNPKRQKKRIRNRHKKGLFEYTFVYKIIFSLAIMGICFISNIIQEPVIKNIRERIFLEVNREIGIDEVAEHAKKFLIIIRKIDINNTKVLFKNIGKINNEEELEKCYSMFEHEELLDYKKYWLKEDIANSVTYFGIDLDKEQEKEQNLLVVDREKHENETKNTQSVLDIPIKGRIGSGFGERIHPISGKKLFHKGLDIEANSGDDIKSAGDGIVIKAGPEGTYGNLVRIRHEDNIVTVYAHCSAILVKDGQRVKKGERIARVGETGAAKGPHLHFEVWRDGKILNPMSLIKFGEK